VIAAAALLLAGVFCLPLLGSRVTRRLGVVDSLAPARVAAILHLVTVVPYLLLVSYDSSVMQPAVVRGWSLGEIERAVAWYAIVQALGFVALVLGTRSRTAGALARYLPIIGGRFEPARWRLAVAFAVVLAGAGFGVFLVRIGGLGHLVANLDKRTALTAGAGYTLALLNFLFFAIAIELYSMRVERSPAKWLVTGGLMLLSAVTFSSLGGRKAVVLIAITALFVWHYGVSRLRRITFRVAVVAAVLVPYFVVMPILRAPGGFDYYRERPDELLGAIGQNMSRAIQDISYVDTYVFITNHFRSDNVWLGTTYLDLLKAPVSSASDGGKPPIDDGVYVRTLAEGWRAEPGMAFGELFYSSWPPETLGATFMNFWLPGTVVGMFLLGALYRLAYSYMLRSGCTLYSILVYAHIVVSFHFSNLRIVQAAVYLGLTTAFFALFFGVGVPSRRQSHRPQAGQRRGRWSEARKGLATC
jgi:hypothetical protein